MRLIDDIRKSHPGLQRKEGKSPLAAIRLFCLECMGGSPHYVKSCGEKNSCPLWLYRFGKGTTKRGPKEISDKERKRLSVLHKLRKDRKAKKLKRQEPIQ